MIQHKTSSKKKKASKNNKKSQKNQDPSLRVFVSGLPADTKKKEFEKYLKQFGQMSHLKLPMRKTNGFKECKGHAKIVVKDKATKVKMLSEGDSTKFRGIFILRFEGFLEGQKLIKKMADIEVKKVSIHGKHNVGIEKLQSVFGIFGDIEKITWKAKEEKKKSGKKSLSCSLESAEEEEEEQKEFYGSITFLTKESAERCLKIKVANVGEGKVVKVRPYLTQFLLKANDLGKSSSAEYKKPEQKAKEISLVSLNISGPSTERHSEGEIRLNYVNWRRRGRHYCKQNTFNQYSHHYLPPLLYVSDQFDRQRADRFGRQRQQSRVFKNDDCSFEKRFGNLTYSNFSISSFCKQNGQFRWLNEASKANSLSPSSLFRGDCDFGSNGDI